MRIYAGYARMSICLRNRGASARLFDNFAIFVIAILCWNFGARLALASNAVSVVTVDGDKKGLNTGLWLCSCEAGVLAHAIN